jgi:hypothetical protein
MNTEQVTKFSEDALNRLITELERGYSDTLKQYLATMSRFRKYSWQNSLLICTQFPAATHVGGYQFWLKMRRHVRKGEKGIAILAPIVGRKRTSDDLPTEDEQTRLFGFRSCHVWDVSQTEGDSLPEFATVKGDPGAYTDRLKAFAAAKGIALEYSDRIAPAKGTSSGNRITLLPSLEPAEAAAVLVHELAHSMMHFTERRSQTTKTVRETEAEAVAFVVSSAIGLDVNSACSDYVALYGGDKAVLTESLSLIQRTASEILQAIDGDPLGNGPSYG